MIQPTLNNFYRNKYNQELHYHPFAIKLDVSKVAMLIMTYLIKHVFR